MKFREIFRSPNYYRICESELKSQLVIIVVAGGVGMYEIITKLLPDEISEFKEVGHLDKLAFDIATNENAYADRNIKPEY